MKQIYKITLSSGEIYVLAGLLKYQSIVGIETETLSRWQENLREYMKPVVSQLEKRKIISYELNGVLFMNRHIHKMMDCLCLTETVWLVSENVKNGKYGTKYFLGKDDYTVLLEKNDTDTYEVILYIDFQMEEWLRPQFGRGQSRGIYEKILLEEAEVVKDKLQCFDKTAAERMLKKCLSSEENIDYILEMFSGKAVFVYVQFYQKNKTVFEHKANWFVTIQDKQNFELRLDENDVLTIESVEKSELLKGVMQDG